MEKTKRDVIKAGIGRRVLEPLRNWFEELYIHEAVWDSEVASRVKNLLLIDAQKVSQKPLADSRGLLSGREFSKSKKRLYLAQHEGHFFRKCPGTQGAACCNYFVLNLGVQCNMNCSYCYLQAYINSPLTQIYTNIDSALCELEDLAKRFPNSPFRIGTGETIDSLSLDDLTLYSQKLVEWFSRYPKLTCEFKTKSDNIKNFIDTPHAGNVIVSFSINPQSIVAREEHGTANLNERLAAARLASNKGFPVAFHIDPMIFVPEWKEIYGELVDQVCQMFEPGEIKWISLGALRYPPEMKHILRERFGAQTKALTGELFLSEDGKLRYDQVQRSEMFKFVIDKFKSFSKSYPVFLCMEASESWLLTYEKTPRKVDTISHLFTPLAAP